MSASIEVRGLQVVQSGRLILQIPQLTINPGEILAVIGPNGAGKSTLLKLLALVQRPARGDVLFDGNAVQYGSNLLAHRRRITLVMQQPLLRDTSVFENVATGLRFRSVGRKETKERVERWLQRLGVAHLSGRHASTLSGGEAQRVSLARALVLAPDLLLLDEPFADLDPPMREGLITDLKPILQTAKATTVFVTHDRDEALRLADRLVVLIGGRLLQEGTPQEVLARPASPEVASFVGTETVLPGTVVGRHDGLLDVDVAPDQSISAVGDAEPGSGVLVCLRPEEVTIFDAAHTGHGSARNHFRGVVTEITDLGLYLRVSLDCGFPLVAYATRPSVAEMGIRTGKEVVASFKATAVHLIAR